MPEIRTAEEFFEHFGVKGMKWGVRRGAGASNSPTSKDAAKASKFQQVAKKSGTRALSNEELQTLVTRMNLEQQYNRLKPPTPTKKATKFVGDFLLSVGKQQASKFANDQFGKFIAGQLGKPRNRQPKVLRITSLR